MFGYSAIEVIGFAITFLLTMLVVGSAANTTSASVGRDAEIWEYVLAFVVNLGGWVLLTAVALAVIAGFVVGGMWVFNGGH